VDAAVREAAQALGGLDAVVCNAGIGATGSVLDNDDDEWRTVFDVNLFGHVRVLRAAVPLLRESPSAAIVTVCSVVAESGFPQRALYSSSKGALLALTMSMAVDFLPAGIRVNAVCPGTTDTPWVSRLLDDTPDPEASRLALQRRQPTGRLVAPEEVARAVGYLLDPVGTSTTGTVVYVDGGLSRLKPRVAANAS
jgi:NAD(P)-dependent dehydrogenase (short-subunit alcohol dehydrogenase family)